MVGADRICANGDFANKIGTYQLALSAKHHGVKFMVVAPSSTVDMATALGDLVEIEERDLPNCSRIAANAPWPPRVQAWNPGSTSPRTH